MLIIDQDEGEDGKVEATVYDSVTRYIRDAFHGSCVAEVGCINGEYLDERVEPLDDHL